MIGWLTAQEVSAVSFAEVFPESEELCRQALEEGPVARAMELRAKEALALACAQKSGMWPMVSGEVGYDYIFEDREDFDNLLTRNVYRAAVSGSYPVYHWGGVSAAAKRGRETKRQSEILNSIERDNLRERVQRLYVQLMLKEKKRMIAWEENEGYGRQTVAALAENLSAAEVESRRLQHAQLELQLEQLTDEAAALKRKLARLAPGEVIGAQEELKFGFRGFPEKLEVPGGWAGKTLTATPTSLISESRAVDERLEGVRLRAESMPNLDIVGGFYQDQVDSVNVSRPVNRNNYFVGVRLRWDIFNGWRSQSNASVAKIRQRRHTLQAKQELLEAQESLTEKLQQLRMLSGSYAIALSRRNMALKGFEAQEALRREGQSSIEAFEGAKRAFDQSEIVALEALTDFLILYEKIERGFAVS